MDDLKATAQGCPPLPEALPSALASFLNAVDDPDHADLYRTANLGSIYEYLRGGSHLQIPPEWKPYVRASCQVSQICT